MLIKLWRLLSAFHRAFGWFVVLVVVYEALQIVTGYTNSLIIRLVDDKSQIRVYLVLWVGLVVYDELFMRFDNYFDWHVVSKQGYPVFKHLKMRAVEKFLSLDIAWHQKHNSGALVGKVANGVGRLSDIIDGMSWEFIPTFIQTILSMVPLLFLSFPTAIIAGGAFVVFLWLTKKGVDEKQSYRKERNDLYENEWHKSVELVQTIETATMFGQKDRLLAEQNDLHDRIMDLGLTEARLGIFKYNRWRIRVLGITRRLVLAFWIYQLVTGTLDVANFIFVSTLAEKLFSSFWRFARLFDRMAEAMEPARRLEELLVSESAEAPGGKTVELSGPVDIRLEYVDFAYKEEGGQKDKVLDNFSVEIPGGKTVALVGPSGAGKTTFWKVVTGLWPVDKGKVFVAGLDTALWDKEKLRQLFSFVPQGDSVAIMAGTVRENIAYPKSTASQEEIIRAAKLSGIHDFIVSLPEGYETQVGDRGRWLSGGQKQRIALARAILIDRPVLILDEATSAVDAITEAEIQEKMKTVLQGKTAIIIAHKLATVWDIADKIVVMDLGRKVEEGTHRELVDLGGLYAQMAALQTA